MTTRTQFHHLDTPADLHAAFGVMRQLRPHLRDSQAFAGQVARQQAQGYRLLAACADGAVVGLAGYRLQENLIYGRFVYVDDLVVDASRQRGGLGGELLGKVREQAVALGCAHFVLDTGLHMALAQRFYFRQGLLARGLHCSPYGKQSHGYRLAAEAIATLVQSSGSGPACEVLERDLAAEPLPPIGRDYAAAITSHAPDPAVFDWSERLIVELEQTDALVINTPMHNFTVPASLKLWIDHVLRIRRTSAATPEGKVGLLRDRPTLVLVGSGGFHSGDRTRQPDFLTPYLRHALGCVGIRSVQFLLLQGLTRGNDAVAAALAAARGELARLARMPRMALFDAEARAA